jgi:hypothetical protein
MNICGPRALSLSENGEGQLPHFVANRSGLLCTFADTAQAALTSLFSVGFAATPGNVATRTVILPMSGLQNASRCEETYISAGLSSVPRELFRVRL